MQHACVGKYGLDRVRIVSTCPRGMDAARPGERPNALRLDHRFQQLLSALRQSRQFGRGAALQDARGKPIKAISREGAALLQGAQGFRQGEGNKGGGGSAQSIAPPPPPPAASLAPAQTLTRAHQRTDTDTRRTALTRQRDGAHLDAHPARARAQPIRSRASHLSHRPLSSRPQDPHRVGPMTKSMIYSLLITLALFGLVEGNPVVPASALQAATTTKSPCDACKAIVEDGKS
eukprot:3209323-Prymnesium_polylepis.1